MGGRIFKYALLALGLLCALPAWAELLTREALGDYVRAPYSVGEPLNDKGVYSLLNSGGAEAGYVFETKPLAPLPGFSGAPINMLVVLDLDGRFIDVQADVTQRADLRVGSGRRRRFMRFSSNTAGCRSPTPSWSARPMARRGVAI